MGAKGLVEGSALMVACSFFQLDERAGAMVWAEGIWVGGFECSTRLRVIYRMVLRGIRNEKLGWLGVPDTALVLSLLMWL